MVVLDVALSLPLGLVFLASSVPKLRHPKGFILTVWEYRILPETPGMLYARLLPPTELFIALLLLTGTAVSFAALCASLLLLSFIVAIGVNLRRGADLDCGCFGARGGRRIGPGLLLQDVGLLSLSGALVVLGIGRPVAVEPWSVFRLVGIGNNGMATAGVCMMTTVVGTILIGESRHLERRWKRIFGRGGRRLHAKTTAD